MKRQTKTDREDIKTQLSKSFDRWNLMSDELLLKEVKEYYPAIELPLNRGQMLKILTMNVIDQIQ